MRNLFLTVSVLFNIVCSLVVGFVVGLIFGIGVDEAARDDWEKKKRVRYEELKKKKGKAGFDISGVTKEVIK